MTPRIAIPRIAIGAAALAASSALCPAPVHAAGIERIAPSTRVLFREGNYAEFGLSYVRPDLRGRDATLPPAFTGLPVPVDAAGRTDNLFDSYTQFSLAYKGQITDQFSFALILDEPYGADTDYGRGSFPEPPGFSYDGTTADLDSYQLTAILAYDVTPQVKVYGGLRAQRTEADAAIPFIGPSAGLPGYTVSTDKDWGYGYLVGAAYQMPEIALRVALTYHSKIEHNFTTREFGGAPIPGLQDGNTSTDVDFPQSVTLEFQSGVAEDTLVFGSVRWVDWSSFAIAPPSYTAIVGRPLVDYEDDWWTYTLGIGRQLTPDLAGTFSILYEPQTDTQLTTLGPVDGRTALTGSLTYTVGAAELTGGLTYGWLGSTENVLETDYSDGDFAALGLRVGYNF